MSIMNMIYLKCSIVRSVAGMAMDKFQQMLDQEMSVLPKNIARHLTENYSG